MSTNLTLLVHDYDAAAARERRAQLQQVLPDAAVMSFEHRHRLLSFIAELEPVPDLGTWPLALIDLQGDGPEARGEHLLATINEHPSLTHRVALIAFTRYGFASRDGSLRAKGARAVLSPLKLKHQRGLRRGLNLLAKGSTDFAHIGEAPSNRKDEEVIRQLVRLFPDLSDPALDEQACWEQAREILHICRLAYEGYDDEAIKTATGLKRRQFDRLVEQLTENPAARALNLVPAAGTKANLGKVIEILRPHLDETQLIWVATEERHELHGRVRIDWVRDRVADRYPSAADPAELGDDAWIPPAYLDALRRFLSIYQGVPKRARDPEGNQDPTAVAVGHLAGELGVEFDQANHFVVHALMCLEDAEYERQKIAA
jgi:hypothetical protein